MLGQKNNSPSFSEKNKDPEKFGTPKRNYRKPWKQPSPIIPRSSRRSNQINVRRVSKRDEDRKVNNRKSNDKKNKQQQQSHQSNLNNNNNNNPGIKTDSKDKVYDTPAGIDPDLGDIILTSVMQQNVNVHWNDIASLDNVKNTLREIVVLPQIIPEYFTGLRKPWKGVLLFGPPGTGKVKKQKNNIFFCLLLFCYC